MVCNSIPTTIVNLPLAGIILMVDCRCMVGLKRNRRKVQIVQKSSGSWIGLKRCPGLVDFDNCNLVTYSQSLRTAKRIKMVILSHLAQF